MRELKLENVVALRNVIHNKHELMLVFEFMDNWVPTLYYIFLRYTLPFSLCVLDVDRISDSYRGNRNSCDTTSASQ
jgi:hypothetical protein